MVTRARLDGCEDAPVSVVEVPQLFGVEFHVGTFVRPYIGVVGLFVIMALWEDTLVGTTLLENESVCNDAQSVQARKVVVLKIIGVRSFVCLAGASCGPPILFTWKEESANLTLAYRAKHLCGLEDAR